MHEVRGRHGDLAAFGAPGILTEEELRHPELYIELYRHQNQAMDRDLMQFQGAVHEMLRARLRNQEAIRKIAAGASMIHQLLSHPEVQRNENLRALLPRAQRNHEEAKDLARPLAERLNEEMPEVMRELDLKDLLAEQANGEPEDPPVIPQTSRRKRNRRRGAGQDTKWKGSTA